ncbi:MAG: cytochrome c3 family protein [Desulfobacteraceae bacterium]|nr:cytochrome c3 family protein [Desulfobacteraceae bacterium]
MTSKRDLKVAVLIMTVLLITGIVCYASFRSPVPENPVRLMFQNKAGEVLFTHQAHVDDYSLECIDCHHNLEDNDIYNCRECHEETGDEDMPSIADAFHAQCKGCHEEYGAGPVECNSCHNL